MTSKELALTIAEALADKLGQDIRILDVHEISGFTDYFVIVTGTSERHVRTLSDAVHERAREVGNQRAVTEGKGSGRWVLVDLFDVVVHVFQAEARDYFGLERLWDEAEPIELPQAS